MEFTAKQIAEFIHGEVDGNPEVAVSNFSKIDDSKEGTITFLGNPKYTHFIYDTKADIVIVNRDFEPDAPVHATLIRVDNAYVALGALMKLADSHKPMKEGKESMSFVSETAKLGENVYVGAFAYIGDNTEVGENSKIYPQVYLGDNVKVGSNVVIYAGAKIYEGCVIGNNCIIHAGAVVGSDGFGFSQENGVYEKIPQMGNVVIEDDVEIGANTTIDRAVMGSTIIHKGVKLDNLIQIAHNCEIGSNTAMAAQVGIAGSTKVGEGCVFGGQVGIGGHITIGDNAKLGAQSGVISNIKEGAELIGSPAYGVKNFFKSSVIIPKLPDIYKQVNALEKELEELKKRLFTSE